jgi:hypothetical protein
MTTGDTDHDELLLLLEICEDFFVNTTPTTRDELDAVLRAYGITGGPGWLIDMLALTRLRLQSLSSHKSGPQHHG